MGNLCCSDRAEPATDQDQMDYKSAAINTSIQKIKTLQSDQPKLINLRVSQETLTYRSEETQDCSKVQRQAPSPDNADHGSKDHNSLNIIEEEEKDQNDAPMQGAVIESPENDTEQDNVHQYDSAPQAKDSVQTFDSSDKQEPAQHPQESEFVNMEQQPKADNEAAPIADDVNKETVVAPVPKVETENDAENNPAAANKMGNTEETITVEQRKEEVMEMFKEAWQFKIQGQKKKQKGRGRLESVLKKAIKENDIRVPIQHHKNNQYIYGLQKVQIDLQDDALMVKYKGETLTIEEFKEKYEDQMRESIVEHCQENKISDLNEFATKASDFDLLAAKQKVNKQ